MKIDRFDYHLPAACIAQEPTDRRDASRLMVVNRETREVTHSTFAEIGSFLTANSRFFRNNAAVLKARIFGQRPTGGKVECLLLQPAEDALTWWCLLKPGKKTQQAGQFGIEGEYSAEVLEAGSNGNYKLRFRLLRDASVLALSERLGIMPLPPYIERSAEDPRRAADNERYQTVYADYGKQVAVAAPTAGLHFTPELNAALESAGAQFHDLTLQIGIGTFHPVQTEHVEDHNIHREWYEIPASALAALTQSNQSGSASSCAKATADISATEKEKPGPRVAVGTTSVRSIEDALRRIAGDRSGSASATDEGECTSLMPSGSIQAEADIYIYPPYHYQGVDHMITNFHLPKSTLLCLVSAFLTPGSEDGIDWLKELYAEAIAQQYRFYSYGDAMLIL